MSRTIRAERTGRVSRGRMIAAADELANALDTIAERRAAQHTAELERAADRAYLKECAHESNNGAPICFYCGAYIGRFGEVR